MTVAQAIRRGETESEERTVVPKVLASPPFGGIGKLFLSSCEALVCV